MRPAAAAVIAAVAATALPAPAARAEPRGFTAGVSIGRAWNEQDGGGEEHRTLGLWGRTALGRRLSLQLELQQVKAPYDDAKIRSGTALLVLDLVVGSRLVPMLFAGAGLDRATYYGGAIDGRHFEGGIGLEYRADGGLFVGVDLRRGGRSLDNGDVILDGGPVPAIGGGAPCCGDALFAPVNEGEYRAMRVTLGVRF